MPVSRILLAGLSGSLLVSGGLIAPAAGAHHSFAAEFDYDAMGTIEGEVIEVLYVNPHARYFVAVTDEAGNESVWDTQTRSISALTRAGWDEDAIQLGERVTLYGNLGRDGARKLWIREVTKPDGRKIYPDDPQAPPDAEEAESAEDAGRSTANGRPGNRPIAPGAEGERP